MKKKVSKKGITLDDLAAMTQRGFSDVSKEIGGVKNELYEFRKETNHRFDIIENKLILGHTREIEHLRDKVIQLEVKFAKFSK